MPVDSEESCAAARDPLSPATYTNRTAAGSAGGMGEIRGPRVLLYNGGGMAFGNALLGFLTTVTHASAHT